MVLYKRSRIFDIPSLDEKDAPRGTIGIPRVLNMYENYPFWATFFRELGFRVVLSPFSTRSIYQLGMESIPSESECYPAKLSHGHVQWLIDQGIKTIFHPCVFYEHQETKGAQNHYNCPIVVSYAENLKNNVEAIGNGSVHYIRPFIAFTSEHTAADRLVKTAAEEWNIPEGEVRKAVSAAWKAQQQAKADIRDEGARLLEQMQREGKRGIVLAGRPYHIDPEINHGIPELIASYGLYVFTEDSLPYDQKEELSLRVVDQWVYHSRLYKAAKFVGTRDDLELIQLNSFGCGLDAVTTDQVSEILEKNNDNFDYKVSWGCDLQTEHERYLTEQIFKKPVFVTDYPKEIKAFYMKMNEDGKTVAAMDCLVPGIGEIIGGSQREDDYDKLLARMNELGMKEEDYQFYLDLRKYGSTRHAGFGLGFERCVMYLTGVANIRVGFPFPRTVGNCEL